MYKYNRRMKNHIDISKQMSTIPASSAGAAQFLFHSSIGRFSNESSIVPEGNKDISRRTNTKINPRLFNVENFTKGFLEHVRLAPKLMETVKGKLRLGARIVQVGGVDKVFKKFSSVENGKKLLKVSQCYLSTTAGPIAGLVFITTEKVAFCSDRSIKLVSPTTGKLIRFYYKVSIPLGKINKANATENVKNPSQKYIQVVTDDNFEVWFMGFLNCRKTMKSLQQVLFHGSHESIREN